MSTLALANANIYTGGGFRPAALLIDGDRIKGVVEPLMSGMADRVIDVDGGYVLPGFVDTHFHLTSLAVKTLRCDLSQSLSADDVVARLKSYATQSHSSFVMGVEWDESRWSDSSFPTRTMLDAISTDRPVLARRICGHIAVVNTVLLDLLSHNDELIDRDSGLVREHAAWEANRHCEPDREGLATGMRDAIAHLHGMGVTGIHDIVEPARLEAYLDGISKAGSSLAIDVLLHCHPNEFDDYRRVMDRYDTPSVRLVGVKCFMDGSLGGRTAALNEPYSDDASTSGTLLLTDEALERIVRGSEEKGITCAMHAIGDRALDTILDVLERVDPKGGHYRIEHCEVTGPEHVTRLSRLPVFLGMQPNFVRNWGQAGGLYEARLGTERLAMTNRFRTLRDAGVGIIFGSDGMPPGPLYGMPGATHHPNRSERFSVPETLAAFTDAADGAGSHGRGAGVIDRGRLADVVVLEQDPFMAEACAVRMTLSAGRVVWQAEAGGH